ncbi:hypothetical protein [Streptomyces sp. GbtcB6]|uniref:hypothetical protein n=1 Tax=Streptomyces sp. GbtcB6 TaxID=2824751 RepID=UPI001C2F5854|nr:hypothetical protein [Streptomyces sp. GbtcB6]
MRDSCSADAEGPLTPLQRVRVHFARADLQRSRVTDLAELDEAHLILLVERLRGRLDDVLAVLDEMTSAQETP